MRNILLVGMMGSGKSTVAKLLAEELGRNCFDTDELIERNLGCSISEYFEVRGEAAFRLLEAKVLLGTDNATDSIISTGGGAVLNGEAFDKIKQNNIVVYLKADAEALAERLKNDTVRPLLKGGGLGEKIQRILLEREPLYEKYADHIIDTTDSPAVVVACKILLALSGTKQILPS